MKIKKIINIFILSLFIILPLSAQDEVLRNELENSILNTRQELQSNIDNINARVNQIKTETDQTITGNNENIRNALAQNKQELQINIDNINAMVNQIKIETDQTIADNKEEIENTFSEAIQELQTNINNFSARFGQSILKFSGEIIGMYTLGLAGNDQAIISTIPPFPPGVFDDEVNGKNGYYTSVNINFLFNPFPFIDVYAKFLARSRPGSPYIPMQLEESSAETFGLSIDSAYGRLNVLYPFNIGIPLDIYLKAGKFDTTPSSFQNVTRYGAENVMTKLRTKNIYAFQLAAVYEPSFADSLLFSFTTNQKFNEAITPLYDEDGSKGDHGKPSLEDKYDIAFHMALEIKNIITPLGLVSAEILYVYNAENIFSGSNFGFDVGGVLKLPGINNMSFPVGLGVVIYEKNIDPFARTALDTTNQNYLTILHVNDSNTISFRRSLRAGIGVGVRFSPFDELQTQLNIGYSFSQVAHIYRDTLTINSASVDFLVTYDNRLFFGGGLFLGTLAEVEWKTSAGTNPSFENGYTHIFRPGENLGFELFGGILFGQSRFIIGVNNNKGLAMNHSLESAPETQIKYRQKGSGISDGLFETGGIFAKLVISW